MIYFRKRFCKTCNAIKRPKRHMSGSFIAEILLWLFFIIPGVIYSFWRLSATSTVCRVCGSDKLVPLSSQYYKKMIALEETDKQEIKEEIKIS